MIGDRRELGVAAARRGHGDRLRGSVHRCAGGGQLRAAPRRHRRRVRVFYAGAGDTLLSAVGLYLVPLAGIAFLWFAVSLRSVLDTLDPAPSAMARGLNLPPGLLFVALLFAGTAALARRSSRRRSGARPPSTPATARGLSAVGYGLVFVFAVRGAGMFALTTTTLLRGAGVLPRARRSSPTCWPPTCCSRRRTTPPACSSSPPGCCWSRSCSCVTTAACDRPAERPPRTPHPTPPRRATRWRTAPPRPRDESRRPQERTVSTIDDPAAAPRPLSDIPGPKPLPVVGNARDLDTKRLVQGLMRLARRVRSHLPAPHPGRRDLRRVRVSTWSRTCATTPASTSSSAPASARCARPTRAPGSSPRTPTTRCGSPRTTSCCRASPPGR